jgi:predicted nucleotide-binding protein
MAIEEPAFENEFENDQEVPPFKVFVAGGRSALAREVIDFVEKELDIETVSLKEPGLGEVTELESLDEATEECCFGLVVLTAESELNGAHGAAAARENAIHEIGFLQGLYGPNNVLVLRQEGVAEFAHISGIEYETFSGNDVKTAFERIEDELSAARDEYEHDCDDDCDHG